MHIIVVLSGAASGIGSRTEERNHSEKDEEFAQSLQAAYVIFQITVAQTEL
jgi:hypothetical protein